MPTWEQTRRITVKYLKTFPGPYAVIRTQYSSSNRQGQNHCISETNYPSVSALCIGAIVMLLKNFVAEENLTNGSMGTIIDIVYYDARGSKLIGALPLHVVVDFPESTLSHNLIPGSPSTHIPIPITTERCERKCCSMITIPLRILQLTKAED